MADTAAKQKPKQNLLLTGVSTAALELNSQSGEAISSVGGFPKEKKSIKRSKSFGWDLIGRRRCRSFQRRRVQTPDTHTHTRAHRPPPILLLPPPSHRRDGSVRSKWLRVSAVESDLNTGVGTDTQTERDAVRKSSPRRTETVPGVQEAQKKTPTGFYFFFLFPSSLSISLFRSLFWLIFYACDQRGYLNWTCELRELTREAGFFSSRPPRWSSSQLASSSLWRWSDPVRRNQVSAFWGCASLRLRYSVRVWLEKHRWSESWDIQRATEPILFCPCRDFSNNSTKW